MKKMAILVINWNDYKNTKECIDSLKKNISQNFDVIFLDNASHDGSAEKIQSEYNATKIVPTYWKSDKWSIFDKDPAFDVETKGDVILYLNDNFGFTGANNIGFRYVLQKEYDSVMLLNNDTIVTSDFIANMEYNLFLFPNNLISCKILYYPRKEYIWSCGNTINWFGKPVGTFSKKLNKNDLFENRYISSLLTTGCCLLMNIAVLRKGGGQDDRYFFNIDDSDYSMDLNKIGVTGIIDTRTEIYHKSAVSVSNKPNLSMYYFLRNLWFFGKKQHQGYKKYFLYSYVIFFLLASMLYGLLSGKLKIKIYKYIVRDIFFLKMGRFYSNIN